MANKKEIIRDHYIRIKMSKEEKELFDAYAKELGIKPSRVARNLIMMEAESKIFNKFFMTPVVKAYIKYAEITNDKEILERIKTD